MHLPEDDQTLPQLVRNLFAVENRKEEPTSHAAAHNHVKLSTMVAAKFEELCSKEPFYGYAVPYNGTSSPDPKTYKFACRWTFEAAQDAKAAAGIDIEQELTGHMATEMVKEVFELADRETIIIFPCLITVSGIMIDPQTFEPVARFKMLYYRSPVEIVPPLDFTQSPPVVA